ncbi:hypothetical protein HDF16_003824 [Granulicella aggregans]|uniref:Uncharacterized protein n=1 Tax=Granulicella aggregans TaxID=474949 RepID=A0A7W8E506_9BACT|nr:hypothetical protein [Granulicella aggregans]
MAIHTTLFTHRENPDGSWDSICMTCLQTVASHPNVRDESELSTTDIVHICKKGIIFQRISDKGRKIAGKG